MESVLLGMGGAFAASLLFSSGIFIGYWIRDRIAVASDLFAASNMNPAKPPLKTPAEEAAIAADADRKMAKVMTALGLPHDEESSL